MFSYSYENLKRIAQTDKAKQIFERYKQEYEEKYSGKSIQTLDYSAFKLIYVNGDRKQYQKGYYERVSRLFLLQVLCLFDEKYFEHLEAVLAVICDEFTWVLPAHNLNKDNTFDYTVIDLFASERAFYLAETAFVFNDKLSPDVKNRIKIALKRNIIDNYESRRFLWDDCHHNWSAVCACGVGLTYLYQFPERFSAVKDRLFNSFNNYIKGVEDDGVVTEGIGYLQYGFGFLCIFFDVYVQLTGERPQLLSNPKIKKVLDFVFNSNLGNGLFLPFADGGFKTYYSEACIHYAIKNLFPNDYVLPKVENKVTYDKALGFRYLNGEDKFTNGDGKVGGFGTVYYQNSQVFINKNQNYVFVAKCGDNCEMHNHNDVGCFELIKDGKKIISDLGAGKYTWEYHNVQTETGRYGKEIFVCGSWGHSVPSINNRPQINYKRDSGEPYGGKVISQTDNSFKVDIARAYEDGLVDSVVIEYLLNNDGISVKYNLSGVKNCATFRFITEIEPIVKDCKVYLDGAVLESKSKIVPTVEKVIYASHHEETAGSICYAIDFEVIKDGSINEDFEIKV